MCLLPITVVSGQQIPLAVLDFEGIGISPNEAVTLTDRLRNDLFRLEAFDIIDRRMMESILAEKDFQIRGCTSDECLVEIGRLIGARQIVGGSVSKLGDSYSISARIVDVETGEVLAVADLDFQGDLEDVLTSGMVQVATLLSGEVAATDTLASGEIDIGASELHDLPRPKFPGKAMMLSLAIPGAGQLYAHRPIKTAGFLAAEVAAVLMWRNYNRRGLDEVEAYKQFADLHWKFGDWVQNADLFGAGWEDINIGLDGTHSLDFYVDMDGDGWPEIMGETGEDGARFRQLLSNPDTNKFLYVRKNDEFYENIGKYNQFFSGWDDSDPDNPWIDDTKSGLVARSPYRNEYLDKRERSNQLRSTASYAISALMFNHVLSAVDAIFSTAKWNRQRGLELQGSLRFDPDQNLGVGGVTLSVTW